MPFPQIVNGFDASAGIRSLEAGSPTPIASRRPTAILNGGRVPILAVSASLRESQRGAIVEVGIDGWLLKPVDSTRLFRLMEGTLDSSKRNADVYQTGGWERGGWLSAAGRPATSARRKSSATRPSPVS